ncbi:MAG: hypothetical protein Q9186_001230 [Xanthomendoza sp. 1 TL-2023]
MPDYDLSSIRGSPTKIGFRTHPPKPNLTTEQQLDQTIQYLEKHNEEVRSHILAPSPIPPIPPTSVPHPSPPTLPPSEKKSIIHSLQTPHQPSTPPPLYHPPPPSHHHPPPHSTDNQQQSAATKARTTLHRLDVFDEHARRTLGPYYVERERRRREREGKVLEVPGGFGGIGGGGGGVGMGVGVGGGEGEKKNAAGGGGGGGGGMYDRARDPRLRRD